MSNQLQTVAKSVDERLLQVIRNNGSDDRNTKDISLLNLNSQNRDQGDKHTRNISLLDLSRQHRVETMLDILRICAVAMDNFAVTLSAWKLNGNASKVESILVNRLRSVGFLSFFLSSYHVFLF